LRWPSEWSHPSALELVKNSPVNCILLEGNSPLTSEMRKLGLTTLDASATPSDVAVVKGEWPGVRMGQGRGDASAGPTGVPWVDSNGWQVRLARLREPRKTVWIRTEFPKERTVFTAASYLRTVVDSAMYGGRWVVELDAELRKGLTAGQPQAKETWSRILSAQEFFRANRVLASGQALGVVGILSDFAGANEFGACELLNLTARLHQPYRILRVSEPFPPGGPLKAVIYADADAPKPELKAKLLDFVRQGGLLVAGDKTGLHEGAPAAAEKHPRFEMRTLGKGRIATGDLSEPYQAAADAQILLSHRYDLLRFWNPGSLGSYLTTGPAGKGALLQIINYSSRPGTDPVSVRVAGPYREARIRLLGDAAPKPLPSVIQKEAIELHLPAIPVYAAIELV
jgi:hypothetical protein